MKSVCACEMMEIPQASSHHQQSSHHEGCHGHDEQSSKPTHHACICTDHDAQGLVTTAIQINAPSAPIADVAWDYADLFPSHSSTELFVYYHSPPSSLPLYLTQATLLL